MKPTIIHALFLGALTALLAGRAMAELPPIIPRDALFGHPERLNPRLSPDGKRLAWTAPNDKGVMQVWVKTIGTEDDRPVTAGATKGIRTFQWAESGTMLLYLQDEDGDEKYHLFGIDIATGVVRDFTPFAGVRAQIVAGDPSRPDELLVSLNLRDPAAADVYRLTLSTGALRIDTKSPGDVMAFFADRQLQIRALQASRPDGGMEIRIRERDQGPWRVWLQAGRDDVIQFHSLDARGKSALFWSSISANTARLVTRPLAGGAAKVLAADDEVDAGDVLFDRRTRRVQAVSFAAGRSVWRPLDRSVAADLAGLQKLQDGDFTVIDRDAKDRTWLVSFTSDQKPIRYYLWSRPERKGTLLFSTRPALESLPLAAMKHVVIPSRDGLKLHSFLTLPPGVPASGLPLVLYVHGGPWMRDPWGYDPTVQWLANRGYAVLKVNYRGSSGYGKAFIAASFKEWGGKMQDDLIDAVEWVVGQGIADPRRVAIYGSSYGGYAVLAGLAFAPEKFACGVDMFGPSHLRTFIESIPPQWQPMRALFDVRVGNIDDPRDREKLEAASPLAHIDRIKRPVLIAQGARDPRVKREESDRMVAALKKHGTQVDYAVYPDEGHGFTRAANRVDFQGRAEDFLARCLGGRTQPAPASTAVRAPAPGPSPSGVVTPGAEDRAPVH
jgi:dipeptidyl aminopeptidase/acylaminoacyl peptidase